MLAPSARRRRCIPDPGSPLESAYPDAAGLHGAGFGRAAGSAHVAQGFRCVSTLRASFGRPARCRLDDGYCGPAARLRSMTRRHVAFGPGFWRSRLMTSARSARGTHGSGGGQCSQVQRRKRQYSAHLSERCARTAANLEHGMQRQDLASGSAAVVAELGKALPRPVWHHPRAAVPAGRLCKRGLAHTSDQGEREARR